MTRIELTEVHWVDEQPACPLHELLEASRLSETELRELVELGVLHPRAAPAGGVGEPWFDARDLATLRVVRRLRDDLELDVRGVSVALALLERIEGLERELRGLRARLPGMPG